MSNKVFDRYVKPTVIEGLLRSALYQEKLENDLKKGELFLAFRPKNTIHFYYQGGRIFELLPSAGYRTHQKFYYGLGSNNYLTEAKLISINNKAFSLKASNEEMFIDSYDRIKENCIKSQLKEDSKEKERRTLSIFYRHSPFCENAGIVLLDMEIGFPEYKGKGQVQVDLLFYCKEENKLIFVEAKDGGNKEILPQGGKDPAVISQIETYKERISDFKEEIKKAYKHCFESFRKFGLDFAEIEPEVDLEPRLLIFNLEKISDSKYIDLLREELGSRLIVMEGKPQNLSFLA